VTRQLRADARDPSPPTVRIAFLCSATADDPEADLSEAQDQWQANVAKADDPDRALPATDLVLQSFDVRYRPPFLSAGTLA
jgi:hypothetical protein